MAEAFLFEIGPELKSVVRWFLVAWVLRAALSQRRDRHAREKWSSND